MKKLISLILCTVMLLSLAPASFASDAKSAHSDICNAVTKALDTEKLEYTVDDKDEDGDEHISVTIDADYADDLELENYNQLYLDLVVNEEYDRIQLYCFYVIEYDEDITVKDYNKLLSAVNGLNRDYNYIKFYADEDYCSVDAEFDSYVRSIYADEVVLDMIITMCYVVDAAYEDLEVFDV